MTIEGPSVHVVSVVRHLGYGREEPNCLVPFFRAIFPLLDPARVVNGGLVLAIVNQAQRSCSCPFERVF